MTSAEGGSTRRRWVLGAVGAAALTLLPVEALLATRRAYIDPESAPAISGRFGDSSGPTVRLVVLGDSTGAGVGVHVVEESVGGQLAQRLVRRGWRVELAGMAISGSRCRDLNPQVSRALLGRPDVALICIGANDSLRGLRLSAVRRDLGAAVRRLQEAGVHTVVATCPYMGARCLAQPLRWITAARGRRVATVQAAATTQAGGVPVELARLTGPIFRADPGTLSTDLFHPSADGYRLWAEVLLPAVEAAARRGHGSPADRPGPPRRG